MQARLTVSYPCDWLTSSQLLHVELHPKGLIFKWILGERNEVRNRESQLWSLQWRRCRCQNVWLGSLALGTIYTALFLFELYINEKIKPLAWEIKTQVSLPDALGHAMKTGQISYGSSYDTSNPAHTPISTSAQVGPSAQAWGLQEVTNQDTSPTNRKITKNFCSSR